MKKLAALSFNLLLTSLFALSPCSAQEAKKGNRREPVKLTAVAVKTSEHVFKQTPQGDLKLFVYCPPEWKAADKRPGILFFFGGGWKNGSPSQFEPQARYFAARGLVTACAEYRIASAHKTTPDKCIEDAKSAIRWMRSHAADLGLDPDRLIGSGGSAGGHLAAATALVTGFEAPEDDAKISCKPNALVLFNPALNFPEHAVTDAGGKTLDGFWPTPFLSKDAPPAIIFFGSQDRMLSQGQEYLAKAKELGCRTELYTAEGQPHGFFNRAPWTQVTARQADLFLASLGYLTGEPSLEVLPDAPALKREE